MLQLLLTAAIPFQKYIDKSSPTHGFINRQAVSILQADGRTREADWLEQHLTDFSAGGDWADTGWMNVGHMYDPVTGRGFRGWPSAPEVIRDHWDHAMEHFGEHNFTKAFFYAGAAAHLVQDLCVPQHAAARALAGHKEFEAYARRYRHRYAVHEGGRYGLSDHPEGWVIINATYARLHYSHCVTPDLGQDLIEQAVSDLLPRAQRTTAGFISFMLQRAGVL